MTGRTFPLADLKHKAVSSVTSDDRALVPAVPAKNSVVFRYQLGTSSIRVSFSAGEQELTRSRPGKVLERKVRSHKCPVRIVLGHCAQGYSGSKYEQRLYNNYSMSPRVGYEVINLPTRAQRELVIITSYPTRANRIIVLVNSQTGFCRRFLFPQFKKASGKKILNVAHYFPYDVKLQLLAHSRSFLTNQKARNAIVGAENLLKVDNANFGQLSS